MAVPVIFCSVGQCSWTLSLGVCDLARSVVLATRSRSALAAEHLFLREQLALFQERKIRPRRADDSGAGSRDRWDGRGCPRVFRGGCGSWPLRVSPGESSGLRAPKANSVCERLVGTARRECPDFFIPPGARHLRRIFQLWIDHYNRGRPQMSLGPGLPAPVQAPPACGPHRERLPAGQVVRSSLSFVACTANTGWKRWRREARTEFLRSTAASD